MGKPGVRTSEFWVTVGVQVIGLVAALGLLTPDQADVLVQAVIQGGGIVAMILSAFGYQVSRREVKKGEAQALAEEARAKFIVESQVLQRQGPGSGAQAGG